VAVHSPVDQFKIEPLIPLQIAGVDISFTNSSLWMMIAVVLSISLLGAAARSRAMIPGRLQVMAEMLYEFVGGMIRDNIGQHGRKYFPFVFSVFMIVLMGNLLGLVPFSFTYTSHIAVTGILALFIFVMVTIIGLVRHGLHFFHLFLPPGVPIFLVPIVVPIEVISYLIRPVTLSVRLFANMMAGHLVLKVFAGFSVAMVTGLGGAGLIAGLIPMAFNSLIIAFELLVALLQAYVYAILTCIYLKDSIELH